jgi:hypothetical protein
MTYRQIEASREVRLWIKDIIVPVITTGLTLMLVPEIRTAVIDKATELKSKVKTIIKK